MIGTDACVLQSDLFQCFSVNSSDPRPSSPLRQFSKLLAFDRHNRWQTNETDVSATISTISATHNSTEDFIAILTLNAHCSHPVDKKLGELQNIIIYTKFQTCGHVTGLCCDFAIERLQ